VALQGRASQRLVQEPDAVLIESRGTVAFCFTDFKQSCWIIQRERPFLSDRALREEFVLCAPAKPDRFRTKNRQKYPGYRSSAYFSVSVCQPGLVQWPLRRTKTSVTRPEVTERLPSSSVSYKYWL
jgi:hypothetical protein